jgi:uncharacterized membrane protein required for colicin V production
VSAVDEARARRALSVAVGVCAVAIAYAFARVVQAWVYPSPDPRTVLNVARIAFYWRMILSTWVGVLATIAASAAFARAPARAERLLPTLVVITALAIGLQGVLVP